MYRRRFWQLIAFLFLFSFIGGMISVLLKNELGTLYLFPLSLLLGVVLLVRFLLPYFIKHPIVFTIVSLLTGFIGGIITQHAFFFACFAIGIFSGIALGISAVFGTFTRKPKDKIKEVDRPLEGNSN